MLANVLLTAYQSLGYEPVVISSDIQEGERAWRSRNRQVFYYDDFLGQITYGELHLQKNEESRLSQFIRRVANARHKRFILTTREYILAEALNRYDHLSAAQLGQHKSVVTLSDYTNLIRAKILYNHLFFSDLKQELKASLIPDKKYWDVIRHRNYNPRVISHVVSSPRVSDARPSEFVSQMLGTLDDPEDVWASIFGNLPAIAREVLIAMASLPSEVLLADVRAAVNSLRGNEVDLDEFRNAISLLEGTFVWLKEARPGRNSRERVIEIRDPSVIDYLWGRLEQDSGDIDRLLERAIFFEQCTNLFAGGRHLSSISGLDSSDAMDGAQERVTINAGTLATKGLELLCSPSPLLIRHVGEGPTYMVRDNRSLEERASFFIRLFDEHRFNPTVSSAATTVLETCRLKWEDGRASSRAGVRLIRSAKELEALFTDGTMASLEHELFGLCSGRLEDTDDFATLVELAHMNSGLVSPPHRSLDSWRSEFREFVHGEMTWLLDDVDDPDLIEEQVHAICLVAEELGQDISEFDEAAGCRIAYLRDHQEYEPDEDEWPQTYSTSDRGSTVDEVDALFESLR